MRRALAMASAVVLALAINVIYAEVGPEVPFGDFTAVEVENFENPSYETKEPMPDGWIPIIREDIVQQIIRLHQFKRVMDFEDPQAPDPDKERVLVIRGKITEFTHGSAAKRYLVGFGAGKGKIEAMCEFVDKETGETIWQRKADGRVIGTGQPTQGAIKGLAKEVAKHVRKHFR